MSSMWLCAAKLCLPETLNMHLLPFATMDNFWLSISLHNLMFSNGLSYVCASVSCSDNFWFVFAIALTQDYFTFI